MHQQTDSRLFKLPPELRIDLYEHVFGDRTSFTRERLNFMTAEEEAPKPELLHACKAIHHEAADLFKACTEVYWRETVFDVDAPRKDGKRSRFNKGFIQLGTRFERACNIVVRWCTGGFDMDVHLHFDGEDWGITLRNATWFLGTNYSSLKTDHVKEFPEQHLKKAFASCYKMSKGSVRARRIRHLAGYMSWG